MCTAKRRRILCLAVQIPRATRQQVLQKLAGQHLTMALMDAACELIPDQVAARDDLRKVALQAAIDQELKLFKSCMSKAVRPSPSVSHERLMLAHHVS